MARKLLIIGGSGFVSGTLARAAVEAGWEVTAVTRGVRALPAGVTGLRVDRNDRAAFATVVHAHSPEWDLVVDAIGYSPDDARQDAAAFSGRVGGFVFVSTDFVYDPGRRRTPQPVPNAAYATSGYGGQKRRAEEIFEGIDCARLPWTIFRPNHIYGPGSLLGCLPLHSRDPDLLDSISQGRPLRLVGGGRFRQQPVFAWDLAKAMLAVHGNGAAKGITCNIAGPDTVESLEYYRILGVLVGREIVVESVETADYLKANPDKAPFCCDRIYDLTELKAAALPVPATPLVAGLRDQVLSMAEAKTS